MIIQVSENISQSEKSDLEKAINDLELKTTWVSTQRHDFLVGTGNSEFDIRTIGNLPGVKDIHWVSDNYQLVSRQWRVDPSIIDLGDDVIIGEGNLTIMAGPCSIESEAQIESTIQHLVENDVKIMRGGVFKPRSSPYSFRGRGIEGLKEWHKAAQKAGIKIISEVMQVSQVPEMYDFIDIYQVGARNTQNFNLLDALGEVDKPVLIKRGISGTIDELLYSAEYVFSGGNEDLMLCERGIRTFERASRNTLDLNAIPILKDKSHLPVIADPSHGIGIRSYVEDMTLASIMAGADGIIFEVHECPEEAFSDGQQTLDYQQSTELMEKARKVFELKQSLS